MSTTDDSTHWRYVQRAARFIHDKESVGDEDMVRKFDPNAAKYRSCCCHVKQFTQIVCIIELTFVLLLLLICIQALRKGPSQHKKITHHYYHHVDVHDNLTHINDEGDLNQMTYNNRTTTVTKAEEDYYWFYRNSHEMQVTYTTWFIIATAFIGLALHGVQTGRRFYLLPYLVIKGITSGLLSFYLFVITVLVFLLGGKLFFFMLPVFIVIGAINSFLWFSFVHAVQCIEYLRQQRRAVGGVDKDVGIVPVYIVGRGNGAAGAQVHFMTGAGAMSSSLAGAVGVGGETAVTTVKPQTNGDVNDTPPGYPSGSYGGY